MLGLKLQALRALEAEVVTLQTQARAWEAAPAPAPQASAPWVLPPYDAEARRALLEGEFATAEALTQMERIMVPGATPSFVELDTRTGKVQVQVDFKEKEALFAYLEALNRQEVPGSDAPARWQLLQARPAAGAQSLGVAVIVSHWTN
jgi:type II secretory pathway component PulM